MISSRDVLGFPDSGDIGGSDYGRTQLFNVFIRPVEKKGL